MKINKILLLLTIIVSSAVAVSVNSQEDNGPIISFEENKFSFDTIARNSNGEHNFFFVNVGSEPLLITSAFSSCGCVVPEFPI